MSEPGSLVEASVRGKLAMFVGTAGTVLILDLFTKLIVQQTLHLYESIPVLGDAFRLTYIYNPGAAFGLHAAKNQSVGLACPEERLISYYMPPSELFGLRFCGNLRWMT